MPKTKIGNSAAVIYDCEPFELSFSEYSEYEEKLNELDQYNPEDVYHKTEWITYHFLEDHGYPVLAPRFPEPTPNMNMFEFGTSEGAAEFVKEQKFQDTRNFNRASYCDDFESAVAFLPQRTRQRVKNNVKYVADLKRRQKIAAEAKFKQEASHGADLVAWAFCAIACLFALWWQVL